MVLISTHYLWRVTWSHTTQENPWHSANPMYREGLTVSWQYKLQQPRVGQSHTYASGISGCFKVVGTNVCWNWHGWPKMGSVYLWLTFCYQNCYQEDSNSQLDLMKTADFWVWTSEVLKAIRMG